MRELQIRDKILADSSSSREFTFTRVDRNHGNIQFNRTICRSINPQSRGTTEIESLVTGIRLMTQSLERDKSVSQAGELIRLTSAKPL